mmetsp:Transcript_5042/g.12200  ORF Transcript_5042/g.12200 Transcript_5042/m.12200 type:complete len:571 (+) Transcript_5042:280-1992(+)
MEKAMAGDANMKSSGRPGNPEGKARASQPSGKRSRRQANLSRAMSKVLRHQAKALGLRIRPDGYVKLSEMLALKLFKNFSEEEKSIESVQSLVSTCSKQRFSLTKMNPGASLSGILEEAKLDEYRSNFTENSIGAENLLQGVGAGAKVWSEVEAKVQLNQEQLQRLRRAVETAVSTGEYYIRANQGHSMKGLDDSRMMHRIKDASEVNVCIHGTYWCFFESIRTRGLNRMSRRHIHFSCETFGSKDIISGMRSTCELLIHIDVEKCLKDGVPLLLSKNRVVLSDGVGGNGILPPEYFSKIEKVEKSAAGVSVSELRDWETCEIPKGAKQPPNIKLRRHSSTPKEPREYKKLKYLCVLDFEATCERNTKIPNQEIIEFPSVLLDVQRMEIKSTFQKYVKPVKNPKLTAFCTELTGITQEKVDKGVSFEDALSAHGRWLHEETKGAATLIVTCGDWDLRTMLPSQCSLSQLSVPKNMKSWCNIKSLFSEFYKTGMGGMTGMLRHLKMELIGRHHSGIDDCKNIARIAARMLQDKCIFHVTSRNQQAQKGKKYKQRKQKGRKHGGRGNANDWN